MTKTMEPDVSPGGGEEAMEVCSKSRKAGVASFPSKSANVIVFDWDDTLLPSTWLAVNKMALETPVVPESVYRALLPLAEAAARVLEKAKTLGDVVIITNAESGWVEMSAAKFMPGVVECLKGIRIVSARSRYGSEYPDSPGAWKECAFSLEVSAQARLGCTNFLSLGDSVYERNALTLATRGLDVPVLTKSVKFVERPTAALLLRQVEMVLENLSFIVEQEKDMDLMLTGSQPARPDEARVTDK